MMGLHLRAAGQPTAGLRALNVSGVVCFSRVGLNSEPLLVLFPLGAEGFLFDFVDKVGHDSSDRFDEL